MIPAISVGQTKQDLHLNYSAVVAEGPIPAECLQNPEQWYNYTKRQTQAIKDDIDAKVIKKVLTAYNQNSALNLSAQFLSGSVLFGDPFTERINKIAALLLHSQSELRNKIKFFVTKTNSSIPLVTSYGLIFIPVNLLALVENDAQLAYIIATCIAKFKITNGNFMYDMMNNTVEESKDFKDLSFSTRRGLLSERFEKYAAETQLYANALILNSSFNVESTQHIFAALYYRNLPFEDYAFDTLFFNDENFTLPIPENYGEAYKTISGLPALDNDQDLDKQNTYSKFAHNYKLQIAASENKGGSTYYIDDSSSFYYIRDLARFETTRLLMIGKQYEKAFYSAYLLTRDYPNNQFALEAMGKCLLFFTKAESNKKSTSSNQKELTADDLGLFNQSISQEEEGFYYQTYSWLQQLKRSERYYLASKHLWNLKLRFPENKSIDYYANVSIELLTNLHASIGEDLDYLNLTKKETDSIKHLLSVELKEAEDLELQEGDSKYDKIKSKKEVQRLKDKIASYNNEWKYVFSSLINDHPAFETAIEKQIERLEKEKNEEKKLQSLSMNEKAELERENERLNNLNKSKGYALGISKIILFDPVVFTFKEKKQTVSKIAFPVTDKRKKFKKKIHYALNKNDIDFEDFSYLNMQATETDKYNTMSSIQEIVRESGVLETKQFSTKNNFIKVHSQTYIANELTATLETSKISLNFLHYTKKSGSGKTIVALASVVVFPLMPYFVTDAIGGAHETYTDNILFDISTGNIVLGYKVETETSPKQMVVKNHLYSFFKQVKQTRK